MKIQKFIYCTYKASWDMGTTSNICKDGRGRGLLSPCGYTWNWIFRVLCNMRYNFNILNVLSHFHDIHIYNNCVNFSNNIYFLISWVYWERTNSNSPNILNSYHFFFTRLFFSIYYIMWSRRLYETQVLVTRRIYQKSWDKYRPCFQSRCKCVY